MIIDLILILGGIVSFIIILDKDLDSDIKKWNNNEPVKHGKESRLRALWLLIPFILFVLATHPTGWSLVLTLFIVAGGIFFNYLNFFDGQYNNRRKFNWWFLGSVDPGDAKTDKFLRKLPKWGHITFKIGGSLTFIILYILKLL